MKFFKTGYLRSDIGRLYGSHDTNFPPIRLVLRIRADDPDAICQLGVKYGCSVPVGKSLLFKAFSLGLEVVGVRSVNSQHNNVNSFYSVALWM